MMARIRSIHPGLFTDEAFVGLSSDAQVFLMGLWTESDDQGVFEWKPTTLRMRLRPTKDGPVEHLLAELCAAKCIKNYELNGRQYGAVRNFRKYQRPKSPNSIHPITDEIRTYVALATSISEIDEDEKPPIPRNGETGPQMEEGGDKREEEGEGKKGKRVSAPRGGYAFIGAVIRLNQKHFDAWTKAFQNLELLAELTARDAWLASDRASDGDRADWFISTSKYLANRNGEAKGKARDEACPPEIYRGLQ